MECVDAALKIAPGHPEALNLLGVALWQVRRFEDSAATLRQAIAARPDSAGFHLNLARTLIELKQPAEAGDVARRATELNPSLANGWLLLGNSCLLQKDFDQAALHYQQALRLQPDFADAHNNLCGAYIRLDQLDEAVSSGRRALELRPDYVDAMSNLGTALVRLQRLDEAEPLLERAVALQPDFADGLNNLGKLRGAQRRFVAAAELFRRAIEIKPDYADAHSDLSGCLGECGQLDEAISHIRACLAIQSDYKIAGGNLLFAANYHPEWTPQQILAEYRKWAATQPPARDAASFGNPPDPERRLRIGYVSPDFRGHACHYFVEPLFAAHDAGQFELYAYSEALVTDAVTDRLKTLVSHWRDTWKVKDEALQAQIIDDGIDILVDLAGHTSGNRLSVFALRAAPVQVSWLGYGHTTGLTSMDYLLTDPWLLPEGAEDAITETPWRLPRVAFAYRPPEDTPELIPPPALVNGYVTFGSLTRTIRVNDRVVAAWSRILHAVPGSRLRLDQVGFHEEAFREVFFKRFARHGIAPERLELVCTRPHWEGYQAIDIALDPFPHNAGTTTLEALWMGVPVLSLADRPPLGRFGVTLLHAIGLDDWVAADVEAYIARAVAAAADVGRLAELRQGMRQRLENSPLLDEAGFTRTVEDGYRTMWRKWCAGQAEGEAQRLVARLLQGGLALHQSGEIAQAEAIYRLTLQLQPDQGDALNLLGIIAHQRGDFAEAESLGRRAVAALPEFADAHYHLGNALSGLGRADDALASHAQAVALEPEHFNAWLALGDLQLARGERSAAQQAYQAALNSPGMPDAVRRELTEALRAAGLDD